MIDIEFLRNNHVAGLEFMDFQNTTFVEELTRACESAIHNGEMIDEPAEMMAVIEKYTGLKNITLELTDWGNLAVDAGFINPYNVFNIKGIELYYKRSQSTFGRWFANNKGQILRGTIDTRTGKVGGDYTDLPFTLYLNRNLTSVFNQKALDKLGGDMASAIAQTILHEIGHIIGGLLMVHQEVFDNLLMQSAIHFLSKSEHKETRVAIINTVRQELDNKAKANDALTGQLAENNVPEEYVMYFSKMREGRNTRRALSLGVSEMNSEVIADAYVIRMGGSVKFLAGMASLYVQARKVARISNVIVTFGLICALAMNSVFTAGGNIVMGTAWLITMSMIQYSMALLPGTYNTPYRRLLNIQQELIARLKNDDSPPAVKRQLIQDLDKARAIVESEKPLLEDTAFQRALLWIFNGSDAKYINIEHHTQMIANHDVNVVAAKISSL